VRRFSLAGRTEVPDIGRLAGGDGKMGGPTISSPCGCEHPGIEVLRRFAHGRLHGAAMAAVERHVAGCDACCRVVQAVPDDRLVGLLRRRDGAVGLLMPLLTAAFLVTAPGCWGGSK